MNAGPLFQMHTKGRNCGVFILPAWLNSTQTTVTCVNWGFSEDVHSDLGCDAVRTWYPYITFRGNTLPPCSGLKKTEAEYSSDTYLPMYKSVRCHNTDHHGQITLKTKQNRNSIFPKKKITTTNTIITATDQHFYNNGILTRVGFSPMTITHESNMLEVCTGRKFGILPGPARETFGPTQPEPEVYLPSCSPYPI
jgi:hypothetical protein